MIADRGYPTWDDLVGAAVLGTERRPFAGLPPGGPLGAVAEQASRTAGLGGVAAAMWAWRQAGWCPAHPPAGPDPADAAPADPRPLLPPGPVRTLRAILEDPARRPVLPEWLRLAAGTGRRLPAEWLPDLLEACPPAARPDLEAAAGPRAAWLAAHHREWSLTGVAPGAGRVARAVLDGGVERWGAGPASDPERLQALAAVRAENPDLGRLLAERIWPDEPGTTRAAVVATLAAGLSPADEPFLEARLDDRRRDVRVEAAALLRRLPDSRLARRMAARTVPLVRVARSAQPVLRVALPPEPDPGARRDGIGSAGRAGGDRESELVAMIAATPLAVWGPALGAARSPVDLVRWAARSGRPGELLLDGWSAAAAATADRGWARSLLDGGARPTADLAGLVEPEVADRALAGWLARTPLADALQVLAGLATPWSAPLSRAVLAAVSDTVRSGDTSGAGPVRDRLAMVALAVDAGQAPATADLADPGQLAAGARGPARVFWARALAQLAATVHFRQAMYQEFR